MTRPVRAPAHLSKPARELYAAILARYELEAHHAAILIKTLEAFDRAEAARVLIEHSGLLVKSRLGELKASPLVAIERDARGQFFAGVKQLGLDIEGPPPPTIRAARRS